MLSLRNIMVLLLLGCCTWLGGPRVANAAGNIALLFENGTLFQESPDGTVLTYPLYCEGNVLCGTEVDHVKDISSFSPQGGELIMDVQICQCDACPDPTGDPFCQTCNNPSCLTIRNGLFQAAPLPQMVVPDATSFAVTMTQHDPIVCADTSGDFSAPGCAGILDLDYRCQSSFNFTTGLPAGTFAGTFIVSTQ